ncbi:MAG: tetratricopeptide repeat protein [Pseudonocardia sp.]
MSSRRQDAVSLRPEAEAVWDQVRAGFTLHDGFWLALLFGAQEPETAEFVARSRALARGRAPRVDPVELSGPDSVPSVLGELVDTHLAGLFATWLIDGGGPDRERTWVTLLQRLNERRDVLRAARPAAVLISFPAGMMGLVRDTAPDLWSVRTLTATVERPSSAPAAHVQEAPPPDIVAGPPAVASEAVAELLLRAATAVGARQIDKALLAAWEALKAAEGDDDKALAHAWLARARDVQGEPLEAQGHALQALEMDRSFGRGLDDALWRIVATAENPEIAARAAERLVELAHDSADRFAESPEVLRDLAVALVRLGDVRRVQGRLEEALSTYAESLNLARDIRATTGDTLQNLRDLSVRLSRIGGIQQARGQLDDALSSYTEALGLAYRIHSDTGDNPDALRDLFVAHDGIGNVQRNRGQLDDALTHHTEALTVARLISTMTANNPSLLRDISISLNRIGDVQEARGRLDLALTGYVDP